jgi:hypothetical protein
MYSLSISKDDMWIGKSRKAKDADTNSIEYHRFGTVPTVINPKGMLKCSLDGFVHATVGVDYSLVDGKVKCAISRKHTDTKLAEVETYNDTGLLEKYAKTENSVVSNAVAVRFPNGQTTRMQFIFAFSPSGDMYLDGATVNASNIPRVDAQLEMLLRKNEEFASSEKTYYELYSSTTNKFFAPHPIKDERQVPTISVGSSVHPGAQRVDVDKRYEIAAAFRQNIDYRQTTNLPFFSHH